ncbi:MAG TPA: cell surface protein SprA [Gemmatimonadaceae bacterium]|nr:cell surface protein SprA [Gemmatimonadaceae bacterium]
MRPLFSATRAVLIALAVGLAWGPPARSQTPPTPVLPARPPADTDTIRRPRAPVPGTTTIPGLELPLELNLRVEGKKERDRNLVCTNLEAIQTSAVSGCNAGFLPWSLQPTVAIKSSGVVADRWHVNIDYDMQREFDASNSLSLYYEGTPGSKWQRVDVGNVTFTPPPSRFLSANLPTGNYGLQITNQFGPLRFQSIFAQQKGNVGQTRQFTIGSRAQQANARDIDDYQIERLRFFFTIDPALLGGSRAGALPNIDILNRSQIDALRRALPDTLRPTLVRIYRLQFGTQPQNPGGPRFRVRGGQTNGTAVYDLLREGVDYVIDRSLLWFALVRPLNESNERLVVAYNVKINGRDTVWTTTGGTPDLQFVPGRDQVANLVMDPTVGPTSAAFRNEIRSVYRFAGSNLARETAKMRIVTGSGRLEHPIAGSDATFLQMFGLAQTANPAEFDAENRIWPRRSDAIFNLGGGAADIRNGQSLDVAYAIHDYFLVFPSLHPFSARDSGGLVVPGNPTNDDIYTIPGEYIYSPQHPASLYRMSVRYETESTEQGGAILIGAGSIRPGSEQVVMDGRQLVRDLDYRVDYDLGRIEFMRADTVLSAQRHVDVRYEENVSFGAAPTTLAGFMSELPVSHGTLDFLAINQSQSTSFNRPELGLQGNSTLTTGVTGRFNWDLPGLTSLASRLPFGESKAVSHFSFSAEVAHSNPQFLARNQGTAYIETFDANGGTTIALADQAWLYSSLPAYGHSLAAPFGGSFFDPSHAATLVWQTNVQSPGGRRLAFTDSAIDPRLTFVGSGIRFTEPVLWLTLLPLDQVGRYDIQSRSYKWTDNSAAAVASRRFRSIQTVLSPAGLDLTRGEFLQFWTLLDTTGFARASNPTLILDFGDVSENALRFAPDTMKIAGSDTTFSAKHLVGFDNPIPATERDAFSRSFNAAINDTGLPGDIADTIVAIDATGAHRSTNVRVCRAAPGALDVIGDPRTNCTVANNKLDEDDIDMDNALNFSNAQRESERILRYVVDLTSPTAITRVGGKFTDTLFVRGQPQPRTRNWVLVRVPFKTPTDSLNDVNRRKLRALRLTIVSAQGQGDAEVPVQLPIAELQVVGARWLDRSNQTLAGIAGTHQDGGFVITSSIGTTDSSAAVAYQPPPGVVNEAAQKGAQFQGTLTTTNEASLRIQTGNLPLYHRAEAFFRFPAGPQYFMAFQRLNVWGRGVGHGWGQSGELQMYIKVGRDENNFYMYRAPANDGRTAAAWTDFAIQLGKFIDLRKRIQAAYLSGTTSSIACTGADSAIIAASPLPMGIVSRRFAACEDGYIVYTIDPAVTAPNLSAVQEVAVGIVRVAAAGGAGSAPINPTDTLELWVDDVRLDQQLNTGGTAASMTARLNMGDFADFQAMLSNRDPNFRQLGEQPSFETERNIDVRATLRLEKLLPAGAGVALPLTISKLSLAEDPLYLEQTDISGKGISGLRKPRNDLTTYSLTARRSTPMGGPLGPVIDNLALNSSYTTGVDRTEFQDGNQNTLAVGVDYLVAGGMPQTATLPGFFDGALAALPGFLQAGPVSALRAAAFRWNPTEFRVSTGFVRGNDRRVSFLNPTGSVADDPSVSTASTRLWRNAGALAFQPTGGTALRWEIQSLRDFRDYRDTTGESNQLPPIVVGPGFERERSMASSASFTPTFSSWFRPRADLSTQYDMLRDPNVRSFATLPGVIGVDSVLATHDSLAALDRSLPRRMTAAQTIGVGTTIDVTRAFAAYARDSSLIRRMGTSFTPIDVSFTRSLLGDVDASAKAPPLPFELALGGPSSFRYVNGAAATAAGQTGTWNAASSVRLLGGAAIDARFQHITTANWIARPDSAQLQAQANGTQTRFPDVTLRWGFRPAPGGPFSAIDASAGYLRTTASVSLPGLDPGDSPEIRRSHAETYPFGGSVIWAGRGSLSTSARYSLTTRLDSLPGSLARTRGNELTIDAGRSFHVPESLGLGLRSDLRTHFGFQQSHNRTFVLDSTGAFQSRLADNGRQSFNLAADTNLQDGLVFTLQASHIVTFDNNLNRRFAQTVLSTVLQFQFFGAAK